MNGIEDRQPLRLCSLLSASLTRLRKFRDLACPGDMLKWKSSLEREAPTMHVLAFEPSPHNGLVNIARAQAGIAHFNLRSWFGVDGPKDLSTCAPRCRFTLLNSNLGH
jgi:hypothetical protein